MLYGQRFPRYGPIFNIAIFGHETKWPKFQQSHIYSLSTPGVEIELIFVLRTAVSEISEIKIAIFGHETWQASKVPEVPHILSFYPRGLKLGLFLRYGQRISRYDSIFKIARFLFMAA